MQTCLVHSLAAIWNRPYKRWQMGWKFNPAHLSPLMTKPTKWHVRPAKTQINLGIRRVWSESSLSAWRKLESSATHWAHSKDSDPTGRMPRLIWVFVGRTCLFVGFVMRRTGPLWYPLTDGWKKVRWHKPCWKIWDGAQLTKWHVRPTCASVQPDQVFWCALFGSQGPNAFSCG